MSTNSVLAMNTKKIWIDVEKNQFYLRHSDRALKILKIRHFDKKMNEEDRFYNIVCKDFLHSFQLDFYPPPLGYLPPPQLFSSSYLPSYACKFQCFLTRKIHNFRADFLVVFVKNINFLIDCRILLSKEIINSRKDLTFYSQLFIWSQMISIWRIYALPPQLKFYPPSLVYPLAFLRFLLPSSATFRKDLSPS